MNRSRLAALVALVLVASTFAASAWAGPLAPRVLRARDALREAAAKPNEAPALPPLVEPAIANRAMGGVLPVAGEEVRLSLIVLTDDPAALVAAGFEVRTVAGTVVTADVPVSRLDDLASLPGMRWIDLPRPLRPHLDASRIDVNADLANGAVQPPYPVSGATGRNVVVGVVDSGIDLAHQDFRNGDGSPRVKAVWDQNDAVGPNPGGAYNYGTAWELAAIAAGTTRQFDTYGHGTHVAGIAAGNGRATGGTVPMYTYVGMAPEADLVIVNTSFSSDDVIDAVQWIQSRAAALGRPSVVNLSLGSQFGSHDGTEALDVAFEALSGPGKIVVASAGNEGNAGLHAEASVPAGGFVNIQFTIPPYTPKPGNTGAAQQDALILESWNEGTQSLSFKVTSPHGYATGTYSSGGQGSVTTDDGTIWVGVTKSGQNDDYTCEINLWDSIATKPPVAGLWTVRISNPTATAAPIDFWIPYDALGAAGAGAYWTTNESSAKTMGSPATSDSIIAVGAYVTKSRWPTATGTTCRYDPEPPLGSLASFSSRGPRRDGVLKPEIAAPGLGIASTWSSTGDPYFYDNVTCARTPDTYHVVSQGTSQAAPHVAGVIALILEKHPTDSRREVLARLRNSARTDAYTGTVPNFDFGYGKVDAQNAINASTPVRLLAMAAAWTEGKATLSWAVADAEAGTRYQVERGTTETSGFHEAGDRLSGGTTFTWIDEDPDPDEPWYRVVAIRADAGREVLGTVRLDGFPNTLALFPSAPNPFAASTRQRFSLDRERMVRVDVLDVAGRRVTTLLEGRLPAGLHEAVWDGRDAQGRPAAAGIYFSRLTADDATLTRRVVLKR